VVEGIYDGQFTLETLKRGRVTQHGWVRYLNHHLPVVHEVECPINVTHASLGHVRLYLITVKLIPDL
jgi:hypothetical protein